MQSPMISTLGLLPDTFDSSSAVRSAYSEMKVLRSGAGWYIGTTYDEFDAHGEIVWQTPGSRDSGYFGTKEAAESSLSLLEALGSDTAAMVLRQEP